MGEKGNVVDAATGGAQDDGGLVAKVISGAGNVASGLGDHAARTVVAVGTEAAVDGLIDGRRQHDVEEEPEQGADPTDTSDPPPVEP